VNETIPYNEPSNSVTATGIIDVEDASLSEILSDGDKSFTSFYTDVVSDDDSVNIFQIMYDSFLDVENLEEFELFTSEFWTFRILNGIAKLHDKVLWDKYWSLQYDSLRSSGEIQGGSLSDIKNPLDDFYDVMANDWEIVPTSDNIGVDINVFFSTVAINDALDWCTKLSESEDYFSDIESCHDKIYFYRATEDNGYCESISDDYKKKLCTDFLTFSQEEK